MAKRYEFKQDRQGTGFFSKLYLTPKQRRSILRWGLYALLLLVLSVVQDVMLCRIRVYGATTDLVPCGIILICVLEGAQKSCIFALIASAVFLFAGGAPGPYSMVFLTGMAIMAAIFREAYLQRGMGAHLVCVALTLTLYMLLNFAMGLFLRLTLPGRIWGFLLSAAMTMPVALILHPICTSIEAMGGNTWKE